MSAANVLSPTPEAAKRGGARLAADGLRRREPPHLVDAFTRRTFTAIELMGPLGEARVEQAVRERWERKEAPALARRIAALDAAIERRIEERVEAVERALCLP